MFWDMAIETIVGFISLMVVTKVLGKSQITQITAFDFISALVLGELVGNTLFDEKKSFMLIIYAVFFWGLLLYITEQLTQKFKGVRKLFEGKPSIVIHKGQIRRDIMKKEKLDLNQLEHLLRSKDVFSLSEVEYAIFETDGSLSVLKKSMLQSPTRKDVNAKPERVVLPISLILDGELDKDNLKEANLTEEWLKEELRKQEINDYKQVMYAEYKEGEGLYVYPY
jgi:uncharacterized membrane protein YcaP (DUF421 family)